MNFQNLVGRVAIVTGATSCVGAATARKMVNLGMKVVGVSRKSLGAAQQEAIFPSQKGQTGEMFFVRGDVTKPDDVNRIVKWTRKEFGRTDVLVNAAGSIHNFDIIPSNQVKMKEMVEARITGTLLFSKAVIVDMLATKIKNGHIITISSVIGKQNWRIHAGVFLATQGCVALMTKVLINEVVRSELPIRVTEIPIPRNLLDENKIKEMKKKFQWQDVTAEDVAQVICNAVSVPVAHNLLSIH